MNNQGGCFLRSFTTLMVCVTVIVAAVAAIMLVRSCQQADLRPLTFTVNSTKNIEFTPAQVQSIKNIGKWEFLSLEMEEMVDTVRPRFIFSDDKLVRIYRGTIRLGVDLSKLKENAITVEGDTVRMRLPKIESLNSNFIDEARAKTFAESGSWDARAREIMYAKAKRRMLDRMLSSNAKQIAMENGRVQMTAMVKALGYKNVQISYE